MLVENIKPLEKDYYSNHFNSVIPDLLCKYYETGEYELTYYISEKHETEYGQAEFYLMMSLFELGYKSFAECIQIRHKGEWYNLCKQYNIYWKHVVLYSLYFRDFDISEFYQLEFDNHIDDELVSLIETTKDEDISSVVKSNLFKNIIKKYPILSFWDDLIIKKQHEVLVFENVKWNIWNNYNKKIGNGKKFGIEKVYDKENLIIYSYKPKEVAASMHIITDGMETIILDCGCELSNNDSIRIPVKNILSELKIKKIDAVFISHAHLDHYGSLNALRGQNIIMTPQTKELIECATPEIATDSVKTLETYTNYKIDKINIIFIPNGHILGSVMVNINWKGKRILYTGDYNVENQNTVEGFNVSDISYIDTKKVDILITETTYGNEYRMLKLKNYETIFIKLCQKQIEYGNKILIPCFAIGRTQEVALILKNMARSMGISILIDGMASKITELYQILTGIDIINRNITICNSDLEFSEKVINHDIILASSGMLKEGSTSAKYLSEIIEKENICIMKVGFINANEHMLLSIINRCNKNINYLNIPLSAHASYKSLIDTIEKLSPNYVIYVHGKGITHNRI